eukprot:3286054-Amphidinium_carterae.3
MVTFWGGSLPVLSCGCVGSYWANCDWGFVNTCQWPEPLQLPYVQGLSELPILSNKLLWGCGALEDTEKTPVGRDALVGTALLRAGLTWANYITARSTHPTLHRCLLKAIYTNRVARAMLRTNCLECNLCAEQKAV